MIPHPLPPPFPPFPNSLPTYRYRNILPHHRIATTHIHIPFWCANRSLPPPKHHTAGAAAERRDRAQPPQRFVKPPHRIQENRNGKAPHCFPSPPAIRFGYVDHPPTPTLAHLPVILYIKVYIIYSYILYTYIYIYE